MQAAPVRPPGTFFPPGTFVNAMPVSVAAKKQRFPHCSESFTGNLPRAGYVVLETSQMYPEVTSYARVPDVMEASSRISRVSSPEESNCLWRGESGQSEKLDHHEVPGTSSLSHWLGLEEEFPWQHRLPTSQTGWMTYADAIQADDAASVCQPVSLNYGTDFQMPASVGSVGHPFRCRRGCKFINRPRGCKDGSLCSHCHLCRWTKKGEVVVAKIHL
eukprot:TRINITY_DN53740_c0_g1_i1.p1 TRINITY_DN53740_c0_g1~~TRINITY_DN53740_c0_g1_i1.p1  ORF type:complete len:217 (-),score=16.39 TRINITY_DN53740_c0_g1_i1:158-808(-)